MTPKDRKKLAQLQRRLKAVEAKENRLGDANAKLSEKWDELEEKRKRLGSLYLQVPSGPYRKAPKMTPARKKAIEARLAAIFKQQGGIRKKETWIRDQLLALDEKAASLEENIRLVKRGKKLGVENPFYLITGNKREPVKTHDLIILKADRANDALERGKQLYAGKGFTNLKAKKQRNPSPAQIRARKAFAKMAKERARLARSKKRPAKKSSTARARNKTVIKAKRVTVINRAKRAAKRNPTFEQMYRGEAGAPLQRFAQTVLWYAGQSRKTTEDRMQLVDDGLNAGIAPPRLKRLLAKSVGQKTANRLVNMRVLQRSRKNPNLIGTIKRAAKKAIGAVKKTAKKAVKPRRRNKAPHISESDISKLSPAAQAQLRAQLGKIEDREARAVTPAQKKAVAKSRRSFLARLGTRLRVIGQTQKIKVSARDLGRCPRKTVKVRARHETDALAKARAKLGGRFDDLRIKNARRGKRRNPKSTSKTRQLREKFTGTKSRATATMTASDGTPKNLAKLGRLVSIKAARDTIKPAHLAWLCADGKGRLHLATTSARLIDGPARNFGEVREIEYEAVKPHLGHKRSTIFFHKMGEEGGRRPVLIADGKGGLKFKGGDYTIAAEGIRD